MFSLLLSAVSTIDYTVVTRVWEFFSLICYVIEYICLNGVNVLQNSRKSLRVTWFHGQSMYKKWYQSSIKNTEINASVSTRKGGPKLPQTQNRP